jgi:GAF domain-containing protein
VAKKGNPTHAKTPDEILRVNRLYAVLSKVNEAIVRIREPEQLFEAACRIAVDDGRFLLAWIGFVDPETLSIGVTAKYGRDEDYLDSVSISLDENVPEGRGPTGVALREGLPFINNDTENNPVMRPWRNAQLARGFRSSASFPLKAEGATTGVITLYAGETGYFDDEEVRLLTRLADDFSFALEAAEVVHERSIAEDALRESNRNLETRIEERTAELRSVMDDRTRRAEYAEALNTVTRAIGSTLDAGEVMQRALDAGLAAMRMDAGTVEVRDEQGWVVRYESGFGPEVLGLRFTDAEAVVAGRVTRTRRALIVADVSQQKELQTGFLGDHDVRSLFAVPLIVNAEVLGCLLLDTRSAERRFTEEDIQFSENLAAVLSLALANALAYERSVADRMRAETELETTRLLLGAADALASGTSLNQVLESLCQTTLRALAHKRVTVTLWNDVENRLETAASVGQSPVAIGVPVTVDQLSELARQVMTTQRSAIIDYEALTEAQRGIANRLTSRLALDIPLVYGRRFLGLLAIDDGDERREFTEREIEIAEGIAAQAAVAIESARLLEDERQRVRLAQALAEIDDRLLSSADRDEATRSAVVGGAEALGADSAALALYSEHHFTVVHAYRLPPDVEGFDIPEEVERHGMLALRTGQIVIVEDSETDPRVDSEHLISFGIHAVIVVPLVVGGSGIGNLYYNFAHPRCFGEMEVEFARRLGAALSLSMENARLFEAAIESQRQATQELVTTQLLLEAGRTLSESLQLEDVLTRLADIALRSTGLQRAFVNTIDMDRQTLTPIVATAGLTPPAGGPIIAFEHLSETSRAAIMAKKTAILDYELPDTPERDREIARSNRSRLVLFVPLLVGDDIVGHISLDEPGGRHEFSDRDIELVEGVAAQSAIAVKNASLFEAERIGREREAALKEIARVSSESMHPEEIASRVVDLVTGLFAAKQAQIRIVSGDGSALQSAGVSDPQGFLQALGDMPVDAETETAAVFRTGRPRIGENIADSVSDLSKQNAAAGGIGSYVLLPVVAGDRTIGTLFMAWEKPQRFRPEDTSFVQTVTAQFAIGLQNAMLFEEIARQADYAQALNEINNVVHATLDFDEIMSRVVSQMTEVMGVDATAVHTHAGAQWTFAYAEGLPQEMRDARLTDAEAIVSMRVLETREPFVSNDPLAADGTNPEITRRFGTTAIMAVPLIVRGEVLAVLLTFYFRENQRFIAAQLDFARKAAATLALALENARLYESQHDIAERLQSALLAMPESIPGIEFSYAYHSATDSSRVGGDFYDIFELDQYRVGITIGDVAGKGLDAAILTSLAKNTIRAHASEGGKAPSRILELTNQVVYRDTPIGSFVTILFGILDRRDATLVYSNAGHTTGAVVRAGGVVTPLRPTGPIVGAFADLEYGQIEVKIEPGDLLFLYTDGLTEARLDQVEFAEDRLFELLSSYRDAPATDVVRDVVDYVVGLTGYRLRDDLAILAAKLLDQSSPGVGQRSPDVPQ